MSTQVFLQNVHDDVGILMRVSRSPRSIDHSQIPDIKRLALLPRANQRNIKNSKLSPLNQNLPNKHDLAHFTQVSNPPGLAIR